MNWWENFGSEENLLRFYVNVPLFEQINRVCKLYGCLEIWSEDS